MRQIFDFEPSEYLITDESSLFDFAGANGTEIGDMQDLIQSVYRLDVSNIGSGNLLEIFARIHRKKGGMLT